MPRIRQIVKHGNSHVILLSPYDLEDFSLDEGMKIDIETALMTGIIKKKRTKK